MKPKVPILAPILRSDTQGRVLAELYSPHGLRAGQSISELARLANATLPTVLRDVDRLVNSGFLTERRVGRNRLVQVNTDHPLYEAMRTIVMFGYGPAAVLPVVLNEISGIEAAYIFGSWAARAAGEPGAEPNDIDVLVVGDVDQGAIYAASRDASYQLGREVNISVVSQARWDAATDGFIQTVKSRPLEALTLQRPTPVSGSSTTTKGGDR
jgi:DNA-binding Lrp family transcriptional regulator